MRLVCGDSIGTLCSLLVTKRNCVRVRDCITPPTRGSRIETMIGGDSPTKSHYSFTCVPIRYTYPPSPAPRNVAFFYLFDICDDVGEKGLGIF